MTTIEIKGARELVARLGVFTNEIEPKITAAISAIALEIKGKIATYPEKPENSNYRRTGTLGRKWNVENKRMGAIIGNNTSYGPWVQDRETQSLLHLYDGWQTVQDMAEEYEPKVLEKLKSIIEKMVSK